VEGKKKWYPVSEAGRNDEIRRPTIACHYCPGIEGWHAGFAQCLLGVDAWEEM